jgi:flagellar hook-associated protein 1 FlgK
MSSISLNVGLKALLASQSGMDTAGHNISNATTPGYSRQELLLAASDPQVFRGLSLGSGVDATSIRRIADHLLDERIAGHQGLLSFMDTRIAGLGQMETLFGEPGTTGLATKIQNLFASFTRLATNPAESALRENVVTSATDLVQRFHSLASGLSEVATDSRAQVSAQVDQANRLAGRIATLNRQIGEFEATGQPANDLRDQRVQALSDLGKIVDVRATENPSGSVNVQVAGQLLVGPTRAYEMRSQVVAGGSLTLSIEGHASTFRPRSGTLAGLFEVARDVPTERLSQLDVLAKDLVFRLNKAHSTGVPASGPFQFLSGNFAFHDQDGDGDVTDESLARAGLDFPVSEGQLRVSVTNRSTGAVQTTTIAIDPESMTVGGLVSALDGIGHLSASLRTDGKLDITADAGYGFDFAQRTSAAPDAVGSFGGLTASIGTRKEPFVLSIGDTLQLTTGTGTATVTFQASDFANVASASADEVAAAINAEPQVTTAGAHAAVVGGRVVIQTTMQGAGATLQITGGTAVGALGLSAGQSATGQANAVAPQVTGTYTGAANETYTFVPTADGTVGATAGLGVDVFDSAGTRVTTLSVGDGYVPGTPLFFGAGLSVAFDLGAISRTAGHVMTLDAVADADTSDILAATGLNAFATGTTATGIDIEAGIAADPGRLATSGTGAAGDNGALTALAAAGDGGSDGLSGSSVSEFYASLVSTLAADTSSAQNLRDTESTVIDSLVSRRDSISGVNVDEELLNLERYQQSYQAAARFLTVVNTTQNELMQILP